MNNTTALLPTGTKIHNGEFLANEYAADHNGVSVYRGGPFGTDVNRYFYVNGIDPIGMNFTAHHDQTGAKFGFFTCVGSVTHHTDNGYIKSGDVPTGKKPFYVYK